MGKKLDSWKNSMKRSFGRKVGRDVALELQKHDLQQGQQGQQQQNKKQDENVHEAEDFPAIPRKAGAWKTLKRSLGRKLGLRMRDGLDREEGEQRAGEGTGGLLAGSRPVPVMATQEAIDAGLTFDEAIGVTAPAICEDLPAPTRSPPARYRLKRTRVAGGSEEQSRFSLRCRVPRERMPGLDVIANASAVAHRNANTTPGTQPNSFGLGTTPTTPGYPHPLEVAAPMTKGKRKFATWPERQKPFWSCCEHSNEVSTDAAPSNPKSSRSRADVPVVAPCQMSEDVQPPASESAQRQRARVACGAKADKSGGAEDPLPTQSDGHVKEEGEPLEDSEEEAALIRQVLLDAVNSERRAAWVQEQRAAGRALLASAESSEDLQTETNSFGTKAPDPRKEETGREESEARAERVRNWVVEWERKKKANDDVEDSLAVRKDTLSASGLQLRSSGPPLVASLGPASCASRLRIRSREQIARESTANHGNLVMIDGWTYSARRQDEDWPPSEPYGNADADVGLATIEEGAEDLQDAPTDKEEKDESGHASTVRSAATSIWREPAGWPDGRGGDRGEVRR
ncbi:hypothetical protein E8E11_010308 [Didymella keratinophila]|nr:hypothetical protein E8E11_010308 [Didymella keratinophila]